MLLANLHCITLNIITFNSLSKTLKNIIESLLRDSTRFNSNDVLVDSNSDNPRLFLLEGSFNVAINEFPQKILKETKQTLKESGVNSLCLSSGVVSLTVNERKVSTPVILTPLEFKIDKVASRIRFSILEEEAFVNPYLIYHLENYLDIKRKDIPTDEIEAFNEFLVNLGLETKETSFIGNYHHHRYQVIKELEELLRMPEYSQGVSTLLGVDQESDFILKLPPDIVFPADTDHEQLFLKAEKQNTVIQGPPGTGKSQVLTNLISKLLDSQYNSIVVSEKRVALEVIRKKLSVYDLDKLCFIASSDSLSSQLLLELKENWNFFENYEFSKEKNLRLSEQYLDNLQLTLDLLSNENLVGGVPLYEFIQLCDRLDLGDATYSGHIIDINKYESIKGLIQNIYSKNLSTVLGQLNPQSTNMESIREISENISEWKKLLDVLQDSFHFEKWADLDNAMHYAADCQIFENEVYKKYHPIFKVGSREQKRFLKLRKEWIKVSEGLPEDNNWISPPSSAETNGLLHMLNGDGNFFSRIRAKKRWKQLSKIPFESARDALLEHKEFLDQKNTLSQINIKFCDLGVENVKIEVPLIFQTLHVFSEDKWKELESISEDMRKKVTTHHRSLSGLRQHLVKYFKFSPDTNVRSFLDDFTTKSGDIISMGNELNKLDNNTLIALRDNPTAEQLENQLFNSHLINFNQQFPAFSKFRIQDIHSKIEDIIHSENQEFRLFSSEILNKTASRFKQYQELLSTPARKLNPEQKELKAKLRKGKSILVKEFSKTRSHPTLRELYNSEARLWMEVLKPVWLSNPTQIAKCFPMEQGLFDVAVFDEASQILLQDTLGTIQRSRRIIVAGDEQQMGPTSYFKSGSTEPVDLLHQASFNWEKVPLQHHYRSANPSLIAFSNKHFYGNTLKAFPAFNCKNAIRMHLVDDGIFTDRKNIQEAKKVAEKITQYVNEKANLGVVAFSEEQLQCIWSHLPAETQNQLGEMVDNDLAFFKSLENVQGDECDKLVISFGYGKNEDGDFHMRFGPMNTSNGRKRLNVLLTRAIHSIDFFCSVDSTAFKISDNESIELLRKWFQFMESHEEDGEIVFPFDLHPKAESNKLTLGTVHKYVSSAKELVTLQQVLESRGWVISYN